MLDQVYKDFLAKTALLRAFCVRSDFVLIQKETKADRKKLSRLTV